jgi:hypothetical protein
MCSLPFENNFITIEGVRFASISKKTPLSKLSFAFVSLALPLLVLQHKTSAHCTAIGLRKLALLGKNTIIQEIGYLARYIQTVQRSSKREGLEPIF